MPGDHKSKATAPAHRRPHYVCPFHPYFRRHVRYVSINAAAQEQGRQRYERDVSETESSRYAFTYPMPGLSLSHFPRPSGTPEQTRHKPFHGALRGRIPQDCPRGTHRGRSSVKLTVIAPKFLLEDSRRSVSGARDDAVHMSCMYPRSRRPKCWSERERVTRAHTSPLRGSCRRRLTRPGVARRASLRRDRVRFPLGANYAEKACLFFLNPL